MIPKIIHYCWFGKGIMPKSQRDCIKGWKKLMPDYTFMRWDENTFDVDKYPLSYYACQVKRYALAADLCRLNVMAEYGGIYLDTDVQLFKRFDDFLDCKFFSAIELYNEFDKEKVSELFLNEDGTPKDPGKDVPYLEILTSTMGCVPNQEMIVRLRDYYNGLDATPDSAFNFHQWLNYDRLVARYCAEYGFRFKDETQYFGDEMVVYGTGLFGYKYSPNENYLVSYHHNAATWRNKEEIPRDEYIRARFDKIGLQPLYDWCKRLKKRIRCVLKG